MSRSQLTSRPANGLTMRPRASVGVKCDMGFSLSCWGSIIGGERRCARGSDRLRVGRSHNGRKGARAPRSTVVKKLIAFALVLAAASPAFAAPSLEGQLQVALGKAFAKLLFEDQAKARAECEAGKKLLTAKTPKYLNAYSEECF